MNTSQKQLKSLLWKTVKLLRGHIEASDYKEYIFPLLFYKRIDDVYKEECEENFKIYEDDQMAREQDHRFFIPEDARWHVIQCVTHDVGQTIQDAFRSIERRNSRLYGIFGDAKWTNKKHLPDSLLVEIIDNFSQISLRMQDSDQSDFDSVYEYLIKQFADHSNHAIADYYTNRSVVRLMTLILDLQPGEFVYDPVCGTGGTLLHAIMKLRRSGLEWRNMKLYGQEVNLLILNIAKMNMLFHDIEEFEIDQGDTLKSPKFIYDDKHQQFDVIFASPPYSKKWDHYACIQHIKQSMAFKTGRTAILLPAELLSQKQNEDMRKSLVKDDLIDAIIVLGPKLLHNTSMNFCVVTLRKNKLQHQKNKILFINGVKESTRERPVNFLSDDNLQKLCDSYFCPANHSDIARMVDLDEIESNMFDLSISRYVNFGKDDNDDEKDLQILVQEWQELRTHVHAKFNRLCELLESAKYGK